MTNERLEEIKRAWIDGGKGLAVVGNASYSMVAELIKEVEQQHKGVVPVAEPPALLCRRLDHMHTPEDGCWGYPPK